MRRRSNTKQIPERIGATDIDGVAPVVEEVVVMMAFAESPFR